MKCLILIPILLSGCASMQGPKEVQIPIAVPCKTAEPTQPSYRFAPPYNTTFEGSRDLIGDRELSLAYENELRVALKSCKE